MKVILSEDVSNLGTMGSVVSVADGYANNYLFPRKLAVRADSGSAKQIEHEMRIIKRREEKRRAELTEQSKKISSVTVEILARAGEEDKLFGSVTTAQIAEKLAEKGFKVDRKNIHLEEPIKALGIYTVALKLGLGVEASIKVWVQPEVEPKAEADEDSAS